MTSAITSAHSQTMLPYNAIEWLFELTEKNGNSALDEVYIYIYTFFNF